MLEENTHCRLNLLKTKTVLLPTGNLFSWRPSTNFSDVILICVLSPTEEVTSGQENCFGLVMGVAIQCHLFMKKEYQAEWKFNVSQKGS